MQQTHGFESQQLINGFLWTFVLPSAHLNKSSHISTALCTQAHQQQVTAFAAFVPPVAQTGTAMECMAAG